MRFRASRRACRSACWHVAGLPGWLVARGYHLVQLPLRARRVRVMADWLAAALFRRDVAELTLARPVPAGGAA